MTSLFLCCGEFGIWLRLFHDGGRTRAKPERKVVFLVTCFDALSTFGSVVRPRATDAAVDASVDTYKMT